MEGKDRERERESQDERDTENMRDMISDVQIRVNK